MARRSLAQAKSFHLGSRSLRNIPQAGEESQPYVSPQPRAASESATPTSATGAFRTGILNRAGRLSESTNPYRARPRLQYDILAELSKLNAQLAKRNPGQNQSQRWGQGQSRFFDDHLTFSLRQHFGKVTTKTANFVLKALNDPAMSVSFYRWAKGQPEFELDVRLFPTLIRTLGRARKFDEIDAVMKDMKASRIPPDVCVYTELIKSYAKANKFSSALSVFREMSESRITPDAYTYSVMIDMYVRKKEYEKAIGLHREMKQLGIKVDSVMCISLISMYGKAGQITEAEQLFMSMDQLNCKRSFPAYCLMINIYIQWKHANKAIMLFKSMCKNGFFPDLDVLDKITRLYLREFARPVKSDAQVKSTETQGDCTQTSDGLKCSSGGIALADARAQCNDRLESAQQELSKRESKTQDQSSNLSESIDPIKSLIDDVRMAKVSMECYWYNDLMQLLINQDQMDKIQSVYDCMLSDHVPPNGKTYEIMISCCLKENEYANAENYLERMQSKGYVTVVSLYTRMLCAFIGAKNDTHRASIWKMMDRSQSHVHKVLAAFMKSQIQDWVNGQALALELANLIAEESDEVRDAFINACIEFLARENLCSFAGWVWREVRDRGGCSATTYQTHHSLLINLHDKFAFTAIVILRCELLKLRKLLIRNKWHFGDVRIVTQKSHVHFPEEDSLVKVVVSKYLKSLFSPFCLESDSLGKFLCNCSDLKSWLLNDDVYHELKLKNAVHLI